MEHSRARERQALLAVRRKPTDSIAALSARTAQLTCSIFVALPKPKKLKTQKSSLLTLESLSQTTAENSSLGLKGAHWP